MSSWLLSWAETWLNSWGEVSDIASVGDESAPSSDTLYYDSVRSTSLSIDGGPVYEGGEDQDMIDLTAVLSSILANSIRKAA